MHFGPAKVAELSNLFAGASRDSYLKPRSTGATLQGDLNLQYIAIATVSSFMSSVVK